MVSRITFEIMRAFGGKWRALVYVDYHLVAKQTFATYEEAYSWACCKQSELEREVKER